MRCSVASPGSAILLLLLALQPLACYGQTATPPPSVLEARVTATSAAAPDTTFAYLVNLLSESGGYFDTDNLISNETSYLHVVGKMAEMGLEGGAYIGVGPDQNFSYMAAVRPEIAFMVDIRRDNQLQHLFFKALFTLAENRLEYLCLLFGKPLPDPELNATGYSADELIAYLEGVPTEEEAARAARLAVQTLVAGFGLPLEQTDPAKIDHIHSRFIESGLDLRFNSHNRRPRSYYPTYRMLMLERDLEGRQVNYLAEEARFQFLKVLQEKNRVIPVVGNLAGPHALAAIGKLLRSQQQGVSVLYTSNVEYYLMQSGTFGRYAENVSGLPWAADGVLVRSYFNRFSASHPQSVPGYASTQLLQTAAGFTSLYANQEIRSYYDLISKALVDLQPLEVH